jgi:PAS domain S-box-containing protein
VRHPRHRGWTAAALGVLGVLFVLDELTGGSTTLVPLYVAGPLLAALRLGRRLTAAIGALAVALALVRIGADGRLGESQDLVRVLTVAVGSVLAVAVAVLRARLERARDRYETLLVALSEVGEGMVVVEDERCVYANPAFERLSGYSAAELAAMDSIFDLVAEEDRADARRRAALRVDAGLVDPTYRLAIRRRDGERVQLELAGVPSLTDGRRQLVVVVRDVTARRSAEDERERLLARSALLAEASSLFDQTLHQERTMRTVARLAVRDLADCCVILLADAPGIVRRVTAVAREPERERALAEAQAIHPVSLHPGSPLTRVLAGGPSEVVRGESQPQLLRAVGMSASAIVPLRARGRVLGVLEAAFEHLDPAEQDDVLELFEDLARRAALALDNARLYEERTAVARTLQRSLLPPELPSIPGMQVAARYLAAGAGNEVGGDFYDCFATGGGDWAVVIGDVCGKGAEAAAVTALARYTLRASVLHSRRPRTVLRQLNEALLRQALDYRFCTVLYAALTPREKGATACVATGGHPLPLVLRAGGGVERAGSPGALLGILDDPLITEERVELAPGDALILYTDGVVEASPADHALAPERLAELLLTCVGRDAGAIAEAVERKALEVQDGRLRDDVAVVVLRSTPFDQPGPGEAQPA